MSKKTELLSAIAGKNRGLLANEIEKVSLLSAISQVEDLNPTPNPIERLDLLEGDWRLLYTTSKDLLGFERFPFFQPGQIYQSVRSGETRIYNIAEVIGVPFLESIVSVVASFVPISQKRVEVKFERSIVGLQRLLNYRNPKQYIELIESGKKFPPIDFDIQERDWLCQWPEANRQGWLEITYLDEDLRIGRGNNGSIFVLVKDSR